MYTYELQNKIHEIIIIHIFFYKTHIHATMKRTIKLAAKLSDVIDSQLEKSNARYLARSLFRYMRIYRIKILSWKRWRYY